MRWIRLLLGKIKPCVSFKASCDQDIISEA